MKCRTCKYPVDPEDEAIFTELGIEKIPCPICKEKLQSTFKPESALQTLNITAYKLDTVNKKVDVEYAEDFRELALRWFLKPTTIDPRGYGAPYGAGLYFSATINGWTVGGWMNHHKPSPKG